MNPTPQSIDDRRAAVMAAALVAAVVIVIGFGSGIGSVLSRNAAPTSLFKVSPGAVTPIQTASGVSDGGITSGVTKAAPKLGAATGSTKAVPAAHGAPAASPTGVSTCAGEPLTTAMLTPFLVHFDKAHLEMSPGEQVAQAMNVDQYVKTHTVLIEAMYTPLVNFATIAPTALNPFVVHFDKAHLETSPGQQVSDATNVDQYTKTHTVLVENMLAPLETGLTAAGC